MAQMKVFLALAWLAIVLATNAEAQDLVFDDDQLRHFKEEIDTAIAKKNASCENYKKVCKDFSNVESGFDFSEVCETVLQIYLCEGPRDIETIRRIGKELLKSTQE